MCAETNTPPAANDPSIFHDTMVGMTWPKVREAAEANVLVLVPVGVIEEHGPHMTLGADTYLACLRCRRIKTALAAAGTRAIIAPPFYWGITDDTSEFPGSFNVRPETMTALITDICQSLHSWGFRRVVFVSDHGNVNHRRTLKDSLTQVRNTLNLAAFSLETMLTDVPVYQPPERPGRYDPDYHAGAAETGVMAKEFPAEVDVRLAAQLKPQSEFKPLGYVGDPASFRQEDALINYFTKGPEYDARRILAFFRQDSGGPAARDQQQQSVVDIDSQARDLIQRYIQALGGREKLNTIRTHIRRGKLREEQNTSSIRGIWSAEGKWLMILEPAQGPSERFGFNGSFGWHAERGRVEQLPEPLVSAISMALDPQFALGLERQFKKLARPVEQRSKERQLKVVEGEMSSGAKAVLAFDAQTGLLWKWNETAFHDYRELDGALFPFAVTIKQGTEARFERMENNASCDATQFDPPK